LPTTTALVGARIFDGDDFHDGKAVVVQGRRIAAVVPVREAADATTSVDLGGGLLAPGFIDLQVNGGGGVQFRDDPTPQTLRRIAAAHRRFGTTGFLPTLVSSGIRRMEWALDAVNEAFQANLPGILGIHLEGPWLEPKRAGAHDPRQLREPSEAEIARVLEAGTGCVLVTLAPERVPVETIARLTEAGVIVAAGHTEATYEQIVAAQAVGLRGFTHLFNAMPAFHSRAPGPVGAAFASSRGFATLVLDGHHLHPGSVRAARRALGAGRLVLVTDAMAPLGTSLTSFQLGSREVFVHGTRCELEDGTLAGTCVGMSWMVRYAVREVGLPLEEALNMASTNAARFLGIDREVGRIGRGLRADLVHLDDDLQVQRTWVGGETEPENG
jgi:N-acetylglucosamine-6-phosphate deacetylase